MGRLVAHGWDYAAAKAHMGKWYKVPVGMGAGVMGLGYWCFAANVFLTIFQSRLVRVPKPSGHLWKFFATGAAGADRRHRAGRDPGAAGERRLALPRRPRGRVDRPDQPRAHQPRHRADDARRRRVLRARSDARAGRAPSRGVGEHRASASLLGGSLAFYVVALYLGFHEGRLVVRHGLTPEQAEEATRAAPVPDHGRRHRDVRGVLAAARRLLVRSFRRRAAPACGRSCSPAAAALAVGTLQGPVQAFPAVNELLDRGGDAGDVIVNLHAQLNMLGGLMVILIGAALVARCPGATARVRRASIARRRRRRGWPCTTPAGSLSRRVEAHRVAGGGSFGSAVAALEPWQALVLVPAARCRRSSASARTRALPGARRPPTAQTGGRWLAARARGVRRSRSRSACAGAARPRSLSTRCRMGLLGFPGRRLALRGLPASRHRCSCSSARRWPGRRSRSRSRPSRTGRCAPVGWKAELDLAAGERAGLVGAPLPRPSPAARCGCSARRRERGRVAAERTAPASASSVGGDRPAARRAPVRACGRRDRRQHRPLRLPDRTHARGHRPVHGHTPRARSSSSPGATRRARSRRTHCACTRPTSERCVVRAAAVDRAPAYQLFDLDGTAGPASRSPELPARARPRAQAAARPWQLRLRRDARRHVRRPRLRVSPQSSRRASR